MNKFIAGMVISAGLVLSGQVFAAEVYTIDPVHSSIVFNVKHLAVSTVSGNFKKFSGTITFDAKDLEKSKAEAAIDIASINTENDQRDGHLKSPDFFDAAKFPQITFVSKAIQGEEGKYKIVGDLTIKGVTKEVSIPAVINGPVNNPMGGVVIGLSGQLTVNRQDYGVSFNKVLDNGGVMVGNDVTIIINLEAHK